MRGARKKAQHMWGQDSRLTFDRMASSMGVVDDMVDSCLTGAKPKAYLRNMAGGDCRRMRPAVLIGSGALSARKPDAVT